MRTIISERRIDIMGVIEHWRGDGERMRKEVGLLDSERIDKEDSHEGLFGEEYLWVERCRTRHKRGGVGVCVRKTIGEVEVLEEWCGESILWVKVKGDGGFFFVCVAYVVPAESVIHEEREDTIDKMGRGLHTLQGEQVFVIMDSNGRIGKQMLHVLVGEETKEIERVSEDTLTNEQGQEIVGLLESAGMVVLNGVGGDESGRATCRGVSVIDWIAVSWKMLAEVSGLEVEGVWEEGKREEGDHKMVTTTWRVETCTHRDPLPSLQRNLSRQKKWNIRKGWRDGWVRVRETSDRVMREWCVRRDVGTVSQQCSSWMRAYGKVATEGVGVTRGGRGGKQTDPEMEEVKLVTRQVTKEVLSGGGGDEKRKRRSEIQKEVRKRLRELKRRRMEEVEGMRQSDKKEDLIRMLKTRQGKKDRQVMGGDREKMKVKGVWVVGDEMKRMWTETFESVGLDLLHKTGFDEDHKKSVESEVRRFEEVPGKGWKGVDEKIEDRFDNVILKIGLDDPLDKLEVKRVMEKLKNNKSTGVDKVVAEILKYGGDWMLESVWMLCCRVWEEEEVPVEWLKAIKVPIRKKGSGEEYSDYRGVTLLSVVGKVYAMVLEVRLRLFLESKGILSDSQFGFRKSRNTVDAVFILTETIKQSGNRAFVGFLDISKAYPSVWRSGLWSKLRVVGVEGKMWRMVKALYSKCEVSVRVGGELQEWYEEFVGVREGCVLSPLLFAVYINDLAEEVTQTGDVLPVLFADDVGFVCKTQESLQGAFDIAHRYGVRWRFEFNVGVEKSAVLVVGGGFESSKWFLGGVEVPRTSMYKYLGVGLDEGRTLDLRRKMVLTKTKNAYWRAWKLGIGERELSAKGSARVWEVVVRSVMEYMGELDYGPWPEAERLQRLAGRRVLKVSKAVPDEVVLGELGWWTIGGRLEFSRLMYLYKLRNSGGVLRRVFERGLERLRDGTGERREWCVETHRLMTEMGLGDLAVEMGSKSAWKAKVYLAISIKERGGWRDGMISGKKPKIKLKMYAHVKTDMGMEDYLTGGKKEVGRMVRLRAGVTRLEIEKGRWSGEGRRERWERVCKMCNSGEVEDVVHFVSGCPMWKEERSRMMGEIRKVSWESWRQVMSLRMWSRTAWLIKVMGSKGMKEARKILDEMISKRENIGKR